MKKLSSMKLWMQAANPEQQIALAARAETSRQYLYHLSGGFRDASPDLARKIEHVTVDMHKETKGELPKVYRTDLNSSCRNCEFAQKCLGSIAVSSEFGFLPSEQAAL